MAEKPDYGEMAAMAGYTVKYFKDASPEMWNIFKTAIDEMWSPTKLQSAIRNTDWFKNTPQPEREAHLLRSSDPADYKRRIDEMHRHVQTMAEQLGVPLANNTFRKIAQRALVGGWSEEQIRHNLGQYVGAIDDASNQGRLGGDLAKLKVNINATARANGVRLSNGWVNTWLRRAAEGTANEEEIFQRVRNMAASAFPTLAEDIEAGANVIDLAAPYIQSMGEILEMNTRDIDLFDPTIRKALVSKDENGKPAMKDLWQFEEDLRRDPRWNKTNNARESMMGAGHQILQLMGVMS